MNTIVVTYSVTVTYYENDFAAGTPLPTREDWEWDPTGDLRSALDDPRRTAEVCVEDVMS